MLVNKQLHSSSLVTASGLPRNFRHPMILLCDALVLMTWTQRAASEIRAVTSVESDTFLWRPNHFSFRANLGPGQLGHSTSTDPTSCSTGGLCCQAVWCKISPCSDVNQSCCRDSSLLWKQEGNPRSLHRRADAGGALLSGSSQGTNPAPQRRSFRPTSAETSAAPINCMDLPFEERSMLNFQLWIFPGYLLGIFLACSHAQRLFL